MNYSDDVLGGNMLSMASADDYRQRGDNAEKRAEQAPTEKMQQVWRDLAKFWRKMAEQAERLQR